MAIINANIITMEDENIHNGQTIIIRDGLIKSIANSKDVQIPSDTQIVDACGKYLIPGLVDMHVHFNSFAPFIGIPGEWAFFIANGVTSVRNMWGMHLDPYHPILKKCKMVENNKIPYPNVYTGGQILESKPAFFSPGSYIIDKPEKAFKIVESEKKKGYEFIKIYHTLNEEAYKAVAAASKEYKIPFLGHVPDEIGIEGAIAAGQHSIEHLIGYFNPFTGKPLLDSEEIERLVEVTAKSEVWNCPTLVVWSRYLNPKRLDEFEKKSEMTYLPKKLRENWRNGLSKAYKNLYIPDNYEEYLNMLVGKLHKAGARLLLGTDSYNPFVVPGFSLHEELNNLVNAGLSPYEAIKAGTKNAAMCLNKLNEFGTISFGKRGDLVLLDKNPLENINNLKSIAGVMVRGIWITRSMLDSLLDTLSNS